MAHVKIGNTYYPEAALQEMFFTVHDDGSFTGLRDGDSSKPAAFTGRDAAVLRAWLDTQAAILKLYYKLESPSTSESIYDWMLRADAALISATAEA